MMTKLRKTADYLLLHSSYIRDCGLFHGKTGIALALYLYSRESDDNIMSDYAYELLQQVYDGVHADMPPGMEHGLAGIGYGVTLLSKLNILDFDPNDILEDIDAKIMERDPERLADLSVRTGLGGVGLYIKLRESCAYGLCTFDSLYISKLREAEKRNAAFERDTRLTDILIEPDFSIGEHVGRPLGIDGGCAYHLLKNVSLWRSI